MMKNVAPTPKYLLDYFKEKKDALLEGKPDRYIEWDHVKYYTPLFKSFI